MSETIFLQIGSVAGIVALGINFYNARQGVRWKQADLANAYLRELTSNQELVFACRALDWNGGRLVVPENLRPLLANESGFIPHDPDVLERAMRPELTIEEMDAEPRIQLYRTAIDTLLSWLVNVASGMEGELFVVDDVREIGYWVLAIQRVAILEGFIEAFGYKYSTDKLRSAFGHLDGLYPDFNRTSFRVPRRNPADHGISANSL
jgi:hypothetical protein